MLRRILAGVIVCVCSFSRISFAAGHSEQTERKFNGISAGLGVTLVRSTDIVDYVNNVSSGLLKQDDFATAAEFFCDIEWQVHDGWNAKLEYSYLLKSYNVPLGLGENVAYSYGIHMPTAIVHYMVAGTGYIVQFGGGIGYHIAHFTVDNTASNLSYRSNGLGLKLEAEANTAFDEHLFGYIGTDIRDDIMSAFTDPTGKRLTIPSTGKAVTMSFFSVGLKFGLSYYF